MDKPILSALWQDEGLACDSKGTVQLRTLVFYHFWGRSKLRYIIIMVQSMHVPPFRNFFLVQHTTLYLR